MTSGRAHAIIAPMKNALENIAPMNTMYLIGGANGVGKTTFARELVRRGSLISLNTDEISARIGDTNGIESARVLRADMNRALAAGQSFAFESTISGRVHLSMIERAREMRYKIILIYVYLEHVEQNITRVRQRVGLGGHHVPEDTIRSRWVKSFANFTETAGKADVWSVYHNEVQYDLVAQKTETDPLKIHNPAKFDTFMGVVVSKGAGRGVYGP